MTTITVELDDELAQQVEDAARRANQSVADWVRERVKPDGAFALARLEAIAAAHGYPPTWQTLYASLADDESFVAPPRKSSRPVTSWE
jgi:hypothetical protein